MARCDKSTQSGFLISLVLIFLFAGCVGEQANRSENTSGSADMENTPALKVGNSVPPTLAHELTGSPIGQEGADARPNMSEITCSIAFADGPIQVRESKDVHFSTYSGDASVNFTYECGSLSGKISDGGLVKMSLLCQFNQPGMNTIWLFADGKPCAQKTIDVLPNQGKGTCFIDSSSIRKDLQAYHYEMLVRMEGFSPDDKLTWICDYTTATRTLGGDEIVGMPSSEMIFCDYPQMPRKDHIEIYVGGKFCGNVSTR